MELVIAGSIAIILGLIIFNDLRRMRIPNMLSLALLALFPVHAAVLPDWTAVLYSIGFAALIFGLCFVAFGLRLMGGGDVKILGALALYTPLSHLPQVLLVFAGAIMAAVVLVLGARAIAGKGPSNWTFLVSRKFPLGFPIGLTGFVVLAAGQI